MQKTEVPEIADSNIEAGGRNGGPSPARRPRPRRCSSPRAVRRRLVDVARRLDAGELDAMRANALTNVYRLIHTIITDSDYEKRIKRIEGALLRAQEYAQ